MGQLSEGNDTSVEYTFDNTGAEEEAWRASLSTLARRRRSRQRTSWRDRGRGQYPRQVSGAIDLYDKYTFVEVPKENAADVLAAMKNVKIKGKTINIEPANAK